MVNEEKYLLVAESIAPEIFKKVLEAKKYIATGKAANSSEAVRLANISRSAFYKYKDRVMEYNSRESNAIVTFYMTMEDVPGVLSSVINHLAEYGANILTINQNIPSDGVAAVTISIRMTDVTLEEEQLLQRLCQLRGVVRVSRAGRACTRFTYWLGGSLGFYLAGPSSCKIKFSPAFFKSLWSLSHAYALLKNWPCVA